MESIWQKETEGIKGKVPEQKAERETEGKKEQKTAYDVIVIGAGMAGLLTAWFLKERGKDVLVLEATEIASGQTGRTTAKITSQHDLKYKKMIQQMGTEKAKLYAKANEEAIREYERLVQEQNIDCQFRRADAYLYTLEREQELQEEAEAARSLGIDAVFVKETELPFPVAGAVCFRNQAQFSPLEFVKGIAAGLEIRERTKVRKVRGHQVVAEDAVYTAEKIVVATHYPICNVPGFYFLRQHQERSYVLALSGCKEIEGMYLGIDEGGLSVRRAGEYLLLGGGGHRTGKVRIASSYEFLRKQAKQYFPDGAEAAHWSAQDCMPHDGIPFIGKYSIFTPDLYVVTGFQKWGMTSSMVAAMLLRDELCGISNPYSRLFSPQRLNLRAGIGNFFVDAGESVMGLTQGLFCRKTPRCSHMGCKLTWNPEEESWDCSCHGSRFDKDGNILDNPTKKCLNHGR